MAAFGPEAKQVHREVTVVAKGFHQEALRIAHTQKEKLLRDLCEPNEMQITRVSPRMPKGSRYATLVLGCNRVEDAQRLCRDGLHWDSRIFNCEPYFPEAEVKQCFKCYGFGHIARFCKANARCGHCGAAAHAGGEGACPQHDRGAEKRCATCGGGHTTWDRRCPEAKRQREKAAEAYLHRPKQFVVAGSDGSRTTSRGSTQGPVTSQTPPSTETDEDGYQLVQSGKRKPLSQQLQVQTRPRGRPRKSTITNTPQVVQGPLTGWARDSSQQVSLQSTDTTAQSSCN